MVSFIEGVDHLPEIAEEKEEIKTEEEESKLIPKKNQKQLCQKRRRKIMLYWTQLSVKLLL